MFSSLLKTARCFAWSRAPHINAALDQLTAFLDNKRHLVVLTGAGISTGSGIPTYRDGQGTWQRSEPIQHGEFLQRHDMRQRYWLRSYAGWPLISAAKPSPGHYALSKLEDSGILSLLVTQNVDRLHQRAGSRRVIDLHGRLDEVVCLGCHRLYCRDDFQTRLLDLNPFLTEAGTAAPDGDADVSDHHVASVTVPDCDHCSGMLKPNVVFFGGSVNRQIVDDIYQALDSADGLLIIGTSLKVFSGYRFCRYAANAGLPMASINPGISRGDDLISTKIHAAADELLPQLITA